MQRILIELYLNLTLLNITQKLTTLSKIKSNPTMIGKTNLPMKNDFYKLLNNEWKNKTTRNIYTKGIKYFAFYSLFYSSLITHKLIELKYYKRDRSIHPVIKLISF